MTEIQDLLSYRVHMVANLLSRGAELRYRREFGVSLWEWRTIALLGAAEEPLSLGHLARAAGIDKSQMSRVVSGLARRRIVLRAAHPGDGRVVRLTLSVPGRRIYQGLIRAAGQRDEAFRNCLTRDERQAFDRVLTKLAPHAADREEKALKRRALSPGIGTKSSRQR
jgi:DNA-binding MarR family transcriptional regulator